jgi:hypothetical protein
MQVSVGEHEVRLQLDTMTQSLLQIRRNDGESILPLPVRSWPTTHAL